MAQRDLVRIREEIRGGNYVFTSHALDEILDDDLTEVEVEEAILSGKIIRTERDALRRKKFIIEGLSKSFRKIGSVCRFSDTSRFVIIIAVYEITNN